VNVKELESLSVNKEHMNQIEQEVQTLLQEQKNYDLLDDKWSAEYDLSKWECFNYIFLRILSNEPEINEPKEESEYVTFLEHVKKTIGERYPRLGYKFKKELIRFLLLYYSLLYDWDIERVITSTKPGDYMFFENMWAFCGILSDLPMSSHQILSISTFFDENGKGDLAIGQLYNALTDLTNGNNAIGWELLDCMQEKGDFRFLVAIINGISSESFQKVFIYLTKLINTGLGSPEAIMALGFVNTPDASSIDEIIRYFESKIVKPDDYSIPVVMALVNLLSKSDWLNDSNIAFITGYFESAMIHGVQKVKLTLLDRVSRLKTQNQELTTEIKRKLLLLAVDLIVENSHFLAPISILLHDMPNPKEVLNFITLWAENHGYQKEDEFTWVVKESYRKNPLEFQETLFSMLISGNPYVRDYANHIITEVDMIKGIISWDTMILDSSTETADKLIESIVAGMLSIKLRLRLIIPLKRHDDPSVRSHLLQWMIWLTHDYGELVKAAIQEIHDESNKLDKEFLDQYMSLYEVISEIWNQKVSVKELDPSQTNSYYFSQFNRIYHKHQSKVMNDNSMGKSVLLQFVTKIQIGRGHHWRIGANSSIDPLNEIKVTTPFPVTYYMSPDRYNFDANLRRNRTW